MSKERFNTLVDLYLDNEASVEEIAELRATLASDEESAKEFKERYHIHKALCVAYRPETQADHRGHSFSAFFVRSGIAAIFVVCGFIIIAPSLVKDNELIASTAGLETIEVEETPLKPSQARKMDDIRRQREGPESSSYITRLRLLGMHPESQPDNIDLVEVEKTEAPRSTSLHVSGFALTPTLRSGSADIGSQLIFNKKIGRDLHSSQNFGYSRAVFEVGR